MKLLFFLFTTFSLRCLIFATDPVTVEFFYSENCAECKKIINLYFPPLQDELGSKFKLIPKNLLYEENFYMLCEYLEQANDVSNENMYAVVNRNIILGGFDRIKNELASTIKKEYGKPHDHTKQTYKNNTNIKERLDLITVLVAGLLDGLNPCVFAAFILFASFLTVSSPARRQILKIGVIYISGCFLTYLILGLGVYRILNFSISIPILRLIVNLITIIILLIFATISLSDAIRYNVLGTNGVILKLPRKLKCYIRKLIIESKRKSFALFGVFVTSVLVTIVESACSGQVYVPTLLLLANNSTAMNHWWGYLLLYNLMFIVPLIVIVVIVTYCASTRLIARISKNNVGITKIFMGMFFLTLAFMISYFEFFQ